MSTFKGVSLFLHHATIGSTRLHRTRLHLALPSSHPHTTNISFLHYCRATTRKVKPSSSISLRRRRSIDVRHHWSRDRAIAFATNKDREHLTCTTKYLATTSHSHAANVVKNRGLMSLPWSSRELDLQRTTVAAPSNLYEWPSVTNPSQKQSETTVVFASSIQLEITNPSQRKLETTVHWAITRLRMLFKSSSFFYIFRREFLKGLFFFLN